MPHTPGPWQVQQLQHAHQELWLQIGYRDHDGASRGPICRINCPAEPMPDGVVAEIKYMATSNENQIANAKLIAAAPTMLELLEQVYSQAGNSAPAERRHALTPALRDTIRDLLNLLERFPLSRS